MGSVALVHRKRFGMCLRGLLLQIASGLGIQSKKNAPRSLTCALPVFSLELNMLLKVHPENPQQRYLARAAEIVNKGGVIIYPTDTVYGIGCSIYNTEAIERVYRIKRQERGKPFSFICSDL